jgi:FHS family Na+ dependent glucose MFS transporter 1
VGAIYSRINFQQAISIAFLLSACLTVSVAYLRKLWLLFLIFVLNGACLGFFEAGSNVYLLQLWGKETAPFMQAIHFMFGSGALIAPLVAKPFLIERNLTEMEMYENPNVTRVYHPDQTKLIAPYGFIAAFLVVNALFNLIVYRIYPVTEEHPSRKARQQPETGHQLDSINGNHSGDKKTNNNHPEEKLYNKNYKRWKILTIALVLLFMHTYLGLEISFGSFLMTFAVKSDLALTKATGANITTLFWSTFTLIRVITIFVIEWAGNAVIILISMTIALGANIILFPYANTDETMLWAGVAMIGIGMSSVWACIFGYLEEFFPVTSVIGSLMIVSAVLGEFVFPVIISAFIKEYPQILMDVVLFCSCSIFTLFLFIMLLCRTKLSPITKKS